DALLPDPQTIEEECLERQAAAQRFHIELAPDAAHGDLEGVRSPRGIERDRLAVDDQRVRGKAASELDDLRQCRAHLVQPAREDAHLLRTFVHLYAGSVHLPLECRLAPEL